MARTLAAWALSALQLGLRTALGPSAAEAVLVQSALLMALAPAAVHGHDHA